MRDLLTNAGYEMVEAVTGEEGVTRPGGSAGSDPHGHPAPGHRRLRGDPADQGATRRSAAIPIIAVTSYALSGDDQKALAAGCDAYVTKPFSPRALLAQVRTILADAPPV